MALALAGCAPDDRPEPADLVLTGGHVVTVDQNRPEAEAVATRGDRIVAVGTAAEIGAYIGDDTEVVDLAGRLAIPGFVESHGHYTSLGRARMILDLTTAESWDDIVAMVAGAAASVRPGEWIEGRGWHQEKWTVVPEPNVDGVPLHHGLSAVSPDNPVRLGHASGHAGFANAMAMELAGIDRGTRDPQGGTIVKDASGEPTGLLRETAQRLLDPAVEAARASMTEGDLEEEFRTQVRLAGEEALSKGVTSFHDAGSSFETIDGFKRLADAGELPVRLNVMVRRESNEAMAERLGDYLMIGYGGGFLTVRSIKRQIDGALGSHGAWLLDPYADLATSVGLVLETPEDIAETARIALENGFQVNTHAIGDRANREVMDIYAAAFEQAGADPSTLRWRIEHAQHVHPDDLPRFVELGLIAAMQGVHCTSDAPWVYRRLGAERAESGAYMWRTLLNQGTVIANGTDTPVEDIDPIVSFHSSVTRLTADGTAFFPEQRMTREEALESYTLAGAYAAFEEGSKGSLTPGKLADIAVLSRDIMTVPDEEILDARVDLTILGGRVVYRRSGG
jgi:hypothetical protein